MNKVCISYFSEQIRIVEKREREWFFCSCLLLSGKCRCEKIFKRFLYCETSMLSKRLVQTKVIVLRLF